MACDWTVDASGHLRSSFTCGDCRAVMIIGPESPSPQGPVWTFFVEVLQRDGGFRMRIGGAPSEADAKQSAFATARNILATSVAT
jgi:hypothetical protein